VGGQAMIWRHLTSKEIGALDKSIPVILPLGAIEQHGPHLNVETDIKIAEFFCSRLDKVLFDRVLIAPSLAVCTSGHHMDFPGTLTASHETMIAYTKEILDSIVRNGFTNLILFNAHGGNQSWASVVVESFGMAHPDCHIALMTWWKIAHKELMEITQTGLYGVGHACEFETSLMQYIEGENVRESEITLGSVTPSFDWAAGDLLRGSSAQLHRSMKEMTPSGIYGDPRAASSQKGEKITEVVMQHLITMVEDMKIGK
jgi:creatinine amidohydrolase